ncbi:MAG: cadherin-like beta sandwich domain-containing protein [Treponema sp.]
MKSLQKVICTIFLAAFAFTGCELAAGGGGGSSQTDGDVSIAVTDANGNATKLDDGENSVTVKTRTATVTVNAPSGTEVKIDGEIKNTKDLTFTNNGDTLPVEITLTGATQTQKRNITVRYYNGAIEKILVKSEDGKESNVGWNNTEFYASVGTKKATITVKTFDSNDKIKIDGTDGTSKEIDFGSKTELTVTVSVTHNGTPESYTGKIYYSDPSALPVENVLSSLKVKDASASTEYALFPPFNPNNTNYKVVIPASVSKVKIEATAVSGVVIDGAKEYDLNEGNNTITVTSKLASNPSSVYTYTIIAKKVKAGASNKAELKSLTLKSKNFGIEKT